MTLPQRNTLAQSVFALTFVLALGVVAPGVVSADDSEKESEGEKMEVCVIKTNMGEMVFQMFPDVAPMACENFERLSEKGYYDGLIFHRVISGFMIQGGDPLGTGYGGMSIWRVPFEDETTPELGFDRKGLLAMANSGPDTNGSQFFVTLSPTPHLSGKHTIFGEIVEGMEVLEAIGKVETGPRNRPIEDVVMETIVFEERAIGK